MAGDLRVIVIDDHDDFRATVVDLLRTLDGVEVVAQGASGEQAGPLIREHRPDVVILDLAMPVTGWAAIEAVRRTRPITKIIVLTAMPEADRHRAQRAGADAVVAKTGREDLGTLLADALARVSGRP